MADRIDIGFFVFVVATSLLTVAVYQFGTGLPNTFLISTLGVPLVFIFSFAAYWAFNVRRALALRLYRNQAFGIGLVSIMFPALAILFSSGLTYYISLLVIFYWIDTSVLAARRTDPLLRDTLHWSKLRILIWVLNLVGVGVTATLAITNSDYTYLPSDPILLGLTSVPGFSIPISALVILPLIARRSKDLNLRKHIIWFGAFPIIQLAAILLALFLWSGTFFVGFAFGGYFLYRSARSLVPLNRIEAIEMNPSTSLGIGAVPTPKPSLGRTH
jgi:hypothetical protein